MQHLSLDQTGLSSDHQHSHDKKIHSRGRPEYSGSYLLWYMQLHHMHFRFPRKFFQISPQIFQISPHQRTKPKRRSIQDMARSIHGWIFSAASFHVSL